MTETVSKVGVEFGAIGAQAVEQSLDNVTAKGTKTEAALKKTAQAQAALAAEGRRAAGAVDTLAGATDRVANAANDAAGGLAAETRAVVANDNAHRRAAQAAGLHSHELTNLSFQLNDVVTSIVSGGDPLRVLAQQGGQVAQIFQVAAGRGIGFRAALLSIGGALAPILAALAPFAIGLGVVVGAFGLFERAVDQQTKHATTFGDTWKATVKVIGDIIADGPIGDGLKALRGAFNATMNAIVNITTNVLDGMVGFFGAAYVTIIKNWQRLPEAFGAIFQAAANGAIGAVEAIVNKTIDGLNVLLKAAGKQALAHIDLPEIKVANAKIAADFAKTADGISASFRKSREGLFENIAAQADREFEARQKATKGAKEHAAERSDEAKAALAAAEATAKYIESLEREVEEAGLTTTQVRALTVARQIDAALRQGNVDAAVVIHNLELERQARVALTAALNEAIDAKKKLGTERIDLLVTPANLPDLRKASGLDKLIDALDEVHARGADLSNLGGDIAKSFKAQDWTQVFSGLLKALRNVKTAFSADGTTTDKIGTAAGIAGVAGSAIGGSVGAGLMGAAAGGLGAASLSTAGLISGPIGWVAAAGAVVGGLLGIFGHSKAKAQAKAQEEADRAQAEADRQARVAQEARQQESTLLELQGRHLEAVNLQRANELAVMDASNQARQREIYAMQDEADAKAAAAARAASYRSLEIQLMEATGNAAGALAARRKDELDATDPLLQGMQSLVWMAQDVTAANDEAKTALEGARQAVTAEYNTQAAAIQTTIDKFKSFAANLRAFNDSLTSGPLARLNPLAQYGVTRGTFRATSALAASGDETALGALSGVSQAYLDAARAVAPDARAYARDLAAVRASVSAAAKSADVQVDAAVQQLVALNQMVSGIVELNTNVVNMSSLLSNYAFALQQATVHQGLVDALPAVAPSLPVANDNAAAFNAAGYGAKNPDVLSAYSEYLANQTAWASGGFGVGLSQDQFLADHYRLVGKAEGRSFATGGSMTVRGPTSGDRVPVSAWVNGGETVSVSRSETMAALLQEMQAMRAEIAGFRREQATVPKDTKTQKDILVRVTRDGDSLLTAAA